MKPIIATAILITASKLSFAGSFQEDLFYNQTAPIIIAILVGAYIIRSGNKKNN